MTYFIPVVSLPDHPTVSFNWLQYSGKAYKCCYNFTCPESQNGMYVNVTHVIKHPGGLTISQSSKMRKDPNVASSWLSLISRLITCTGAYVDEPWSSNPAVIRVHAWILLMSNTRPLGTLASAENEDSFDLMKQNIEDTEMVHIEDCEEWVIVWLL